MISPTVLNQWWSLRGISSRNRFSNPTPGNLLITEPQLSEKTIPGATAAADYIADKVVKEAIFAGLYWYARKHPLTFAGRVIGHGLPVVGWAMFAYDIYDIFLND